MNLEKLSSPFLGFLQATGLVVYISLVSLFLSNGSKIFGPKDTFLAPITFLLLFIVSAMTTGSIALARAGFLFWEKRYKESFTLIGGTLGWCVFYLLLIFLFLFASK